MKKEEYYYWLCNLSDIGIKKTKALLELYENPENIYHAREEELVLLPCLTKQNINTILSTHSKEHAKECYDKLLQKGIYFVTKDNPFYPKRLKHLLDAPIALYVKGNLPKEDKKSIAIVGARNCSNYGKEMARYFARELAKNNIEVVSGLARGIDSFAHQGALQVNGSTYGVLGCGIDICYPRENIELYMQMQEIGGIISEYGPGIAVKPGLFPMRNRIISGLSDGILVIEAKERSGSLITVDMGLEQGKDIYALPGRATDTLSRGCNNIIKMGAKIVSSVEDILEDYLANYNNLCLDKNYDSINKEIVGNTINNKPVDDPFKKIYKQLETEEKIVYACLSLNPKHMEQIMFDTKYDIPELMDILVSLQLKQCIKQIGNNYYVLST